jgi:hypothetical protein
MKKRWYALPALASALLTVSSCYPGGATNVQQLDLVITTHDKTVDFTSFTTYVLLDSVVHVDLEDNNNDDLLTRVNDALILSQIRSNIEALGYVEEADPANNPPDVILLVGAWAFTTTNIYAGYPWWGWYGWYPYWPCCGPGYGWGYPVYPTVVQYDTGTLAITMVNPISPADNMLPVMWVAGINGLLSGSETGISARVSSTIDQAFNQSPYLNAVKVVNPLSLRSPR